MITSVVSISFMCIVSIVVFIACYTYVFKEVKEFNQIPTGWYGYIEDYDGIKTGNLSTGYLIGMFITAIITLIPIGIKLTEKSIYGHSIPVINSIELSTFIMVIYATIALIFMASGFLYVMINEVFGKKFKGNTIPIFKLRSIFITLMLSISIIGSLTYMYLTFMV